jgi:hypothetical protein
VRYRPWVYSGPWGRPSTGLHNGADRIKSLRDTRIGSCDNSRLLSLINGVQQLFPVIPDLFSSRLETDNVWLRPLTWSDNGLGKCLRYYCAISQKLVWYAIL